MKLKYFMLSAIFLIAVSKLTGQEKNSNTVFESPSKTKHQINEINLIPQPSQIEALKGHFEITKKTSLSIINGDDETLSVANYFNAIFSDASGYKLQINQLQQKTTKPHNITFEIAKDSIQKEGYQLSVSEKGIHLKANEAVGLFYGIQTLRQLLPLEIDGNTAVGVKWIVPAVNITDYPRFGWRGLHLDVSRHFFSTSFVKKYIDHMVRYKLNVFHWHLVDGPGWRIPIDAYPKLIETGSWRVDKTKDPWGWQTTEMGKPTDGRPAYGGFYTKEDIKDVVKYASDRFVQVIPEIEMPGHSFAALVAYPELACVNNDILKEGTNGKDVFCAGNEESFKFLEAVLDETMALFPSKLIHIGGDEVWKAAWQNCPRCQMRMKEEGLKDEHELQSYFIKRMATYIESKGREIIGWDEILEGGLAQNAKVMSWRGMDGGIKSANMGHDVVMAPNTHTYFDLYQGNPAIEPPAYSKLFLTDVYKFDPVPENIEKSKQHHILGGHACLWTEFVQTPEHAEYMLFPRLFALAETVWSAKENLNWDSFINRSEYNFNRLDKAGINYAKSAYNVEQEVFLDTTSHTLNVSMRNELNRYDIRYTLDGSTPTRTSNLYKEPFALNQAASVKAATFKEGVLYGKISEKAFINHLANGKKVIYTYPYGNKYAGCGNEELVNGLTGSNDFKDKHWQGFEKNDVEITIDLGEETQVSFIKTNFLYDRRSWVHLPVEVVYSVSKDGETFTEVARIPEPIEPKGGINLFQKEFPAIDARFIKVFAKNIGFRPKSTTQKAWLFIDEIIVE